MRINVGMFSLSFLKTSLSSLLISGLLAGCAVAPGYEWTEGHEWEVVPSHAELPSIWVATSQQDMFRMCRQFVNACAIRNYNSGFCYIIAQEDRENTPKWLVEHEEKHCEGYNHK